MAGHSASIRRFRPHDAELSLATRAAWLYYVGGHTQGEIASRLEVSSAKANRLIAKAQQRGVVKVFIEGEPAECIALEDRLAQYFDLASCVVVPRLEVTDTDAAWLEFAGVGVAGARFLNAHLEANEAAVVGLGKGRTVTAAVERMRSLDRPDLKFVSISGGLTRNMSVNPFDVIHKLIELTGGNGYFLPVPYIADSVEEKALLLAQKGVRDVLALARSASLFTIGVGDFAEDAHVRQTGMVTAKEWKALKAAGAVGDILGSFLDGEGRPVASDVNERSVGLHIDDLRGKRVLALVGGADKGAAVLAALRSGVITDLIVGEAAAEQAVALLSETSARKRRA